MAAITDRYLRLVCGDEELDLHDLSLTYLAEGGFSPEAPGTDITWRRQGRRRAKTRRTRTNHGLSISLKTAADMGRYATVMRDLERFETYARRYEEKRQENPVYLRYRWHSAGLNPLLGVGALQKRIYSISAGYPKDLHTHGYFQTPTILKMPVSMEGDAYWTDRVNQLLGIGTGGLVEWRRTAGAWNTDRGLQIADATTNQVTNPIFEDNVTDGWWLSNGTRTRDTDRAYIGSASARLKAGAGVNSILGQNPDYTLGAGSTVTISLRLYRESAVSCSVLIYDTTNVAVRGTVTPSSTAEWEFLTVSWTNDTGLAADVQIRIQNLAQDAISPIWADAVQMEVVAYPTPFCAGCLGPRHTWSGTAHNSTSSRLAATLTYDVSTLGLNARGGAIAFWFRTCDDSTSTRMLWDAGDLQASWSGNITLTDGTNTSAAAQARAVDTWYHLAFIWSDETGLEVVYNGVSHSTNGTLTLPTLNANLYLGSTTAGATQARGWFDDLRVWGPTEIPAVAEILAIYNSTREAKAAEKIIGVPPYLWTASGGGQVDNRDDGTGECLGVIGTPRGDEPAELRLYVLGEAVNTILNARIALRHRGFPYWYAILEQGDGDAGTGSNVADGGANDGNKWRDGGAGILSRAWYLNLVEGGEQRFFGRFRVFGRFEVSVNTAEWDTYVRITCEPTAYSQFVTDTITLTDAVLTNWFVVDYGEVSLPQIEYPEGLSDVEQLQVYVRADRVDGTGSRLDLDYLLLLPVDDEGHIVTEDTEAPIDAANVELILDTITRPPVQIKANTSHQIIARPLWSGKPLYPTPRGPNRLVVTGSKSEDTTGWTDYIETTMYLDGFIRSRYTIAPDV